MEPERRSIKETSSLSQSRKGPKTCYGATRNPENSATDYKLVTHHLALSDTLQGLAIKYGVNVEQIRRVNKLWTNDNILIFKTINIPVKLTFDDGLTENTSNDNHHPGTSRDTRVCKPRTSKTQECDSEESVDSGVHEVNHADINVDIEGQSRIESPTTKDALSNSESLNTFLKKLDGEMKTSIQNAKKQRAKPASIHNLDGSNERSKRHKQADGNHVRLKNNRLSRSRTSRSSQSLDEDSGCLDDLFEL